MPKGVKKETTEPNAEANGKPKNKMDGVRQAMSTLGNDAKPLKIQEWLKTSFKIKMPISTISNYKSTIMTGAGKKGRPAGKKGGRPKAALSSAGEITVEDIEAVKALVDQLGAEKVQQLALVLAK